NKAPGAPVLGGTRNGAAPLVMRVERLGDDTLLGQIFRLVVEAQQSRVPVQRIVDRVARLLVPTVVVLSLLTFGLWAGWGPHPRVWNGLLCGVAVLVVACPCALALATPLPVVVATGRGARQGVLFHNAEAIQVLHQADTVLLDKTGTLTEGHPR